MKEWLKAFYAFMVKREHMTARTARMTEVSRITNAAIALGKIALGIYSLSLFVCVNGFYNIGMSFTKHNALGIGSDKTYAEQLRQYRRVGLLLTAASVLYIVYSLNMALRGRGNMRYDLYASLAIATFTFTEIGMSIAGLIGARKVNNLAVKAMKRINLVNSLVALVLTQSALMSLEGELPNAAKYCGYTGLLAGAVGVVVGLLMLRQKQRVRKNDDSDI